MNPHLLRQRCPSLFNVPPGTSIICAACRLPAAGVGGVRFDPRDAAAKENFIQEIYGVGLMTGNEERQRERKSLHTAAAMGEGGNVICTGQKVRGEILTHFLFLLLG